MVRAMSSACDAGPLESPKGPLGVRVTTPPAVAAVLLTSMSRVTSLCGCAGERAMTVGEEWLTGPRRGEMKPEPSDAADDAPRHFEQVKPNRADRRRRQARAREDGPAKIRQ